MKSILIGSRATEQTALGSTRLPEEHNERVVSWQAKARKFGAGLGNGEDVEEARLEVVRGVDDVIESFSEYVAGIATGKELDVVSQNGVQKALGRHHP